MFPRQPRLVVFCQVSIWREVERIEHILRSCSGRVRILASFYSVVAFMFFSSQSLRLLSVEGIKLRIYVVSQDKKSRLTKLGLWCEGILNAQICILTHRLRRKINFSEEKANLGLLKLNYACLCLQGFAIRKEFFVYHLFFSILLDDIHPRSYSSSSHRILRCTWNIKACQRYNRKTFWSRKCGEYNVRRNTTFVDIHVY